MLMTTQKPTKIGNSWGTIIPSSIWKEIDAKPDGELILQVIDRRLVISGEERPMNSITPEFVEMMEEVHKRYGPALAKLAKK